MRESASLQNFGQSAIGGGSQDDQHLFLKTEMQPITNLEIPIVQPLPRRGRKKQSTMIEEVVTREQDTQTYNVDEPSRLYFEETNAQKLKIGRLEDQIR